MQYNPFFLHYTKLTKQERHTLSVKNGCSSSSVFLSFKQMTQTCNGFEFLNLAAKKYHLIGIL